MRLDGKVVLITGASSGLGWEMARQLGRRGARLGLAARRAERLEALVDEVERSGGGALALPMDVCDAEAVRAGVAQVRERFGALDVVIANAGMNNGKPAAEYTPDEVRRLVDVNLLGAIWTIQAGLEVMLKQPAGGQLVGVSSLASLRGLPSSPIYSATKAGLNTYLESVRADYAPRNIRVTAINPGFVRTPMLADSAADTMPFALDVDDAAARMLAAIEAERHTFSFPAQTQALLRLSRVLPTSVADTILRSMRKRKPE